jgi:Cysteine-rich secretory protein family
MAGYLRGANDYVDLHNGTSILHSTKIDDPVQVKSNKKYSSLKTQKSRLLLTTATVTLVNNCGFDASIGIIYYNKKRKNIYIWPKILKGKTKILRGVSDPTIYLYGIHPKNPKKRVWGSKKSRHCISSGECLEPNYVGSLSKKSLRYKLCADSSKKTPSPISKTPPAPTPSTSLSAIETQWLNGHNSRRTKYYANNGLGPKNLKWSSTLKASAQRYANKLIDLGGNDRCVIQHGFQGDDFGGENLHTNWGTSVSSVSASPDDVLTSWFEEEIDLPYGQNGHATQVVFRSTRYVGCATSQKTLGNGGKCFINVCRYISPGNCNMSPSSWRQRTLDDEAGCPPLCPDEGCF